MRLRTPAALVLLAAAPASAAGLVIPDEPDLPPLALVRHEVRVEVHGPAASTRVEQVFENHTERRLEAQYVFPVPEGAVLSRFEMEMGGRKVQGELLRKEKARRIYETAVARSGDAGLLEYLGNDVFQARLFPIEPQSRLEISIRFEGELEVESGLFHYVYPLRHGTHSGPTVHGRFALEAVLNGAAPIRNVYSPSHRVVVDRSREREVTVRYSDEDVTLAEDFHLYYGTSEEDVGLSLFTHRRNPSVPGHFLLLVSPRSRLQAAQVIERDFVFVVDTSGSMLGEKMLEAKNALHHAITSLNAGDRIALVRFSTDVYPWSEGLVQVTEERRRLASEWVDGLKAQGGTDISGALSVALSFPKDPVRPLYVLFLTDGRPTLGKTVRPEEIIASVEAAVAKASPAAVRVFTWGIGYDVDPRLLDGIASAAGGESEYVRPEEDISVKLASFFRKTSHPVLAGVTLGVQGEGVRLLDLHPRSMPDLYAGGQLVLAGRYEGDGEVTLRLEGRVQEEVETFDYPVVFPREDDRHGFVEVLWARRRIAYLLDSIRLRGEEKEVVDEVVRLSTEHGIQTPYTSFLVLDDGTPLAAAGIPPAAGGGRAASLGAYGARLPESAKAARDLEDKLWEYRARPAAEGEAESVELLAARRVHNRLARSLDAFQKESGQDAVEAATYLGRLRRAERAGEERGLVPFRKACGTRFFSFHGVWVDERFQPAHVLRAIRFGSRAYFALLEARPELIGAFRLGKAVVYVTPSGKALGVGSTGVEEISSEEIAELFRPAAG